MRITSEDEIPYQIDGDPGGHLPVEVEVVPKRVSFLVPRKTAKRLAGASTVETR
jgi:diacylglycerol kinase family enzyme